MIIIRIDNWKRLGKTPLNYGQNVFLGNLSSLGKLSIWAKNLWAKCLLGQIVILGIKSLGKMLPWAKCLWAFWKLGHFNFQSSSSVCLGPFFANMQTQTIVCKQKDVNNLNPFYFNLSIFLISDIFYRWMFWKQYGLPW